MVVEVKTLNGKGRWAGSAGNVTNYTINEDSTPLDPNDTSGSTGAMSFGVSEVPTAKGTVAMLGSLLELRDDENGSTKGVLRTITTTEGLAGLEIEGNLSKLNADRNVEPFVGTLGGAFAYYFGAVGINAGEYRIEGGLETRNVVFPGWADNMWLRLKNICAAQTIEIALVSGIVVVRPVGGRTAVNSRDSSVTFDITSGQEAARSVEVTYYGNEYKPVAVIYPKDLWNDNSITVETNSFDTITETVNASIIELIQPSATVIVDQTLTVGSVYTVVDKDNNLVQPTAWANAGGDVRVALGETNSEIVITIVGPNSSLPNGPFKLAMPYGLEDDISTFGSLRIAAEAVVITPKILTIPTGADPRVVTQEVGVTVQNPFVSSLADAHKAGARTAMAYSGVRRSLSVKTGRINRIGESGSARFYTFDEFQAANPGLTFDGFQVVWNGQTFDDFEAFYRAVHDNDFSNQAFGNLGGARVYYRNSYYRIRSGKISPLGLTYDAEPDTKLDDFEAHFTGVTYDQLETLWAGRTFDDQAATPLWKDESDDY